MKSIHLKEYKILILMQILNKHMSYKDFISSIHKEPVKYYN